MSNDRPYRHAKEKARLLISEIFKEKTQATDPKPIQEPKTFQPIKTIYCQNCSGIMDL